MLDKIIFLSLLIYILPLSTYSQGEVEEAQDKLVILDAGFNMSSPVGPFQSTIGHNLYGFGLGSYFQLKADNPYVIGLDILYNYIDGYSIYFFENIDGQDIELTETTSTHLATFMVALRYYPEVDLGNLKPYVQLSMGVKIPFTQTYLRDNEGGEWVSEYDINKVNSSFSYGGAIGVNYQLSSFLFLNAKVSYIPGASTGYYRELPEAEIQSFNFSIDGFEKVNSRTPIINYSVGFSFFL